MLENESKKEISLQVTDILTPGGQHMRIIIVEEI